MEAILYLLAFVNIFVVLFLIEDYKKILIALITIHSFIILELIVIMECKNHYNYFSSWLLILINCIYCINNIYNLQQQYEQD